jgi:glycosyltransferase involved in cell wall biosynthesis
MRLLFTLPQGPWPQVKVGRSISAHALCRALTWLGVEVALLAGQAPAQPSAMPEADTSLGYPVFHAADAAAALPAVANAWRPDRVVVRTTGLPDSPLMMATLAQGIPCAVFVDAVDGRTVDAAFPAHTVSARVANSRFTARRMNALFGGAWHVCPPIIDAADYLSGSQGPREGDEGTAQRVLFVNPVPSKGVELAFALAEACPEIGFDFVQSWPLQASWARQCESRARALPNVAWMQATDDMRPVYGRARLVLVPSISEETFGRVIVEAQVNGIPALASNRGALPEVLADAGVALDPHAGLSTWVAALRQMHRHPAPWATRAKQLGQQHAAAGPLIAGELMTYLATHAA